MNLWLSVMKGHSNISWRYFCKFWTPPPDRWLTLWPDPPTLTVSLPQNFSKRPLRKNFSKRKAFETPLERKCGCKTQKWKLNHLISSLLPPFLVNTLLFQSLFTLFFYLFTSKFKCKVSADTLASPPPPDSRLTLWANPKTRFVL